jgi:hypothetical protein
MTEAANTCGSSGIRAGPVLLFTRRHYLEVHRQDLHFTLWCSQICQPANVGRLRCRTQLSKKEYQWT